MNDKIEAVTTINLPWGAWYQDTEFALSLPEDAHIDVLAPADQRALTGSQIAASLDDPIGTRPLPELARGCISACIVVDDLARPTRATKILEILSAQLQRSGISANSIEIIIATGSHGPLSSEEVRWKVGERMAGEHRVHSHDCRSNLAGTGIVYGDRELRMNRNFLEADLKISIGSVLPHSFAGFSGGAKLVLPGLADLESIARSHKFVQLGLRGGSEPNANRFRVEAEQIARKLQLSFVVCVVTNALRETIGVFAGDVVEAHRAACLKAKRAFETPVAKTYDCAILNAYPKDCDLVQAANSFIAWKTARQPVIHEDGLIVLASAASHGVGKHGLFDPGGMSYRTPAPLRHLRGRELWVFAPGLTSRQVHQLYWDGYRVLSSVNELEAALSSRLGSGATIAVFPCASMQQVNDLR